MKNQEIDEIVGLLEKGNLTLILCDDEIRVHLDVPIDAYYKHTHTLMDDSGEFLWSGDLNGLHAWLNENVEL